MKLLVLALLLVASHPSDTPKDGPHFYYVIESAPAGLPGADTFLSGILVLVRSGDGVCVSSTAGAECRGTIDDGYGYAVARFDTAGAITNISVDDGQRANSVDNPAPGTEY